MRFALTSFTTRPHVESHMCAHRLLRVKDVDAGKVPVVLVANKADMMSEASVTREEMQQKARQMNAPLVEASAKEATGVAESFEQAVREHRKTSMIEARERKQKVKKVRRVMDVCPIL